jgi:hypothetical protein
MKKTLLTVAIMALGTSVFAQVSATSTVNGFTNSGALASGNQVSSHSADAFSFNNSTATANGVGGVWTANAGTTAETSGRTHTAALTTGLGSGGSFSSATQSGEALANRTSLATGSGPGTGGNVFSGSSALVGTGSSSSTGGTPGTANGTSFAAALNNASGLINAPLPASTGASGVTFGFANAAMAAPSTGSGIATAGGTLVPGGYSAVQSGLYGGTIFRP